MSSVTIRRGDTFGATGQYSDAEGNPINLTTQEITIKSEIRQTNGVLVEELTVAIADQTVNPGQYYLSCASTESWPLATLLWNIKYTNASSVSSTDAVQLQVCQEITQ